ncbi:MAG: hypothetical protein ABIR79_21380 [Candidatus Binatia bacterium]
MSRSSILLIAALAVAAVLARFLLVSSSSPEGPRDHPPESERAQVSVGSAPTPGSKARVGAPPAAELAREETVLMPAQVEKMQAAAESLRQRARFPPTSRRIEDNMDPIVATRAVKERMSPPGQGRAPTLVVFASSVSYEAPNPIILFARFIREWPDDFAPRTDAELAGDLVNAAGQVVAEVDLLDDGQERDIEAGDGIFTARLTPAANELARWNGLIRVRVYGETGDGERRSAKTRFYYGAPGAKLTGNYQDQLMDGHLQILAEVDVKTLGEYRIDATVSGSQGLLAFAQSTVALEPGIVWMPITFWGLTLREAHEPGPYRLSSIALANVTLKPPQLNDAISTSYETEAYDPKAFNSQPYNDPKLLQRADRIDARSRGETARVP